MDSPESGTTTAYTQYTVVTANWLTRKPHSWAALVTAIITFGIVLGALAFWTDFHGAFASMAASKALVFGHHEYWRAWTTLLVHGDGKHLLSNIVLFFVLGSFLTGYFGLWLVPVSAFVCGGLVNLLVLAGMPEEVQLIGVSGVVFWMAGAWLLLYFLIETRRSLVQRGLRSFGVGLALFMPAEAFDPSISYKSHLYGFILGLAWALIYFLAKKKPLREAEIQETRFEEADRDVELKKLFGENFESPPQKPSE